MAHKVQTLFTDDIDGSAAEDTVRFAPDGTEHEIDLIAYPHGKGDDRVARAAREAGFTRGFVTGRSAVRRDTDPFLIPRLVPPADPGKLALRIARAMSG